MPILCCVMMLAIGGPVPAASLLGGTVLAIDREAQQVILQMPEGHPSVFPASTKDLLKDVKIGDRVSIEVDRDGKITKLIKLPVDQGN